MEAFDVLYKLKLKPIIQILSPNYPSAPCRAPPKMYTQTRTRTHTHRRKPESGAATTTTTATTIRNFTRARPLNSRVGTFCDLHPVT